MTFKLSDNCSYVISVSDTPWLVSGPTYFRGDNVTYSTADGSLKQSGPPTATNGSDILGPYKKVVHTWKAGQQEVHTAVRYYNNVQAVVFSQVVISHNSTVVMFQYRYRIALCLYNSHTQCERS